jgi:hypothetical protein
VKNSVENFGGSSFLNARGFIQSEKIKPNQEDVSLKREF